MGAWRLLLLLMLLLFCRIAFTRALRGRLVLTMSRCIFPAPGGELSGSFYNHSTVWRFRLEGEIDSSGLIRFWTVQDSFAGRFVGEGEIVGRRLDTLSGWTGVFALVESVDGVAQLSREDFADTLRGGHFVVPPPNGMFPTCDTMWPTIEVYRPVVQLADTVVAARIQATVDEALYGRYGDYASAKDYVAQLSELTRDTFYFSRNWYQVFMNERGILSLIVYNTWTPWDVLVVRGHNELMSFDLQTGRQIGFGDFLKPGYERGLTALGAAFWVKRIGFLRPLESFTDLRMPEDFMLTPLGIAFRREHADGYFDGWNEDIFIPYGDLLGLLREDLTIDN